MHHVRYKVNGESTTRRLFRRTNFSLNRFLEERNDLRKEALAHYRSVNDSRVAPVLEDIESLSLWHGSTLIQKFDFKAAAAAQLEGANDDAE